MTTTRHCVLCPRTHPDGTEREPNWAAEGLQVCEGHYARTECVLEVIPVQWSMLSAAPGSGSSQARVSGSAEQSLGVRVPVLDLMGPANLGAVRDRFGDQAGYVSVATVLDSWCSDWAELRGESRPLPTVARLAEWLRDRLPWAVGEVQLGRDGKRAGGGHPALDDFSQDLQRTAWALRAANGDLPGDDEHKDGIECAKCDMMTLFDVGDFIECITDKYGCGKLYKPSEYRQWCEMKGYFLRSTIACPDCGETALAGASKLNKVECLKAKGGCGSRMTWKQYTKAALNERRPERSDWAVA